MVSTKRLYVIELGHIIELLVVIKRTFILLEEGLFAKEYPLYLGKYIRGKSGEAITIF